MKTDRKDDIKVRLSLKSILLFEQLTGKSFNHLVPDDFNTLLYSSIVTSNPGLRITRSAFDDILKSDKVASGLFNRLQKELEYIEDTMPKAQAENASTAQETASEEEETKLGETALAMAINYGLDLDYILDKMDVWELVPLARMSENKTKTDMADKRFWTYMTILPHIDGKKAGGPEKLLPFPWEKEGKGKTKKEEAKEFMDKNKDAIEAFFKRQEEKEDEWKSDNQSGPEVLQ